LQAADSPVFADLAAKIGTIPLNGDRANRNRFPLLLKPISYLKTGDSGTLVAGRLVATGGAGTFARSAAALVASNPEPPPHTPTGKPTPIGKEDDCGGRNFHYHRRERGRRL